MSLVGELLKTLRRNSALLLEVKKLRERNRNLKFGNAKLRALRIEKEAELEKLEISSALQIKALRQEISLTWDKLNQEREDNGNSPASSR